VHELSELGADDEALEIPPEPGPPSTADVFADFEELESETTRIDDSNLLAEESTSILESAPAQPFLEVEKGKDRGREFVLQEGENGIGRGIDNDVILSDVAVSRRHLKIFCTAAGLTMRDLGSGNGTLVNATKVSTVELAEGDRIELGETTLVVRLPGASRAESFNEPGETTDEQSIPSEFPAPGSLGGTPSHPTSIPNGPGYQPEMTPSGTSTPVRPAVPQGSVVLPKPLVILVLVGGALLLAVSAAALAALVISSGGDDAEPSVVVGAASHYDLGVRAYNAQQWADAEEEFRAALEEPDPPESQDAEQIQQYLNRTAMAVRDQPIVDRARRLLGERDLAAASREAGSVREQSSPLYPTAQRLLTDIRQDQALAAANLGSQALRDNDVPEAQRQLGLAAGYAPRSPAVALLRRRIAERTGEAPPAETSEEPETPEEEPEEPEEPEAEQVEAEAPAAPAQPSPGTRSSRGRRSGRSARGGGRRGTSGASGITRTIIAQYLAGNFTQAASMAETAASARGTSAQDRTRLTQLARNIRGFARLWPQIQRANFGSRVSRQMSQAMALDGRIATNPRYRSQLRGHLVQLHLANANRQRSNPVRRCQEVQLANRIDSSNADVRRASHECEAVARGMMAGAARQPVGRRGEIYGRVLRMVPPSSAIARDAGRLAAQSRRQTQSYDEDE